MDTERPPFGGPERPARRIAPSWRSPPEGETVSAPTGIPAIGCSQRPTRAVRVLRSASHASCSHRAYRFPLRRPVNGSSPGRGRVKAPEGQAIRFTGRRPKRSPGAPPHVWRAYTRARVPIYEYECGECESRFDRLQRLTDADPNCPDCGGTSVRKHISVFAAASRASVAPRPARSTGCACGGACSCRS